jgi:general stress protein YciG
MAGQKRGFAQDPERASKAGKKGAAAQPTEAKRKGGRNSHQNR